MCSSSCFAHRLHYVCSVAHGLCRMLWYVEAFAFVEISRVRSPRFRMRLRLIGKGLEGRAPFPHEGLECRRHAKRTVSQLRAWRPLDAVQP